MNRYNEFGIPDKWGSLQKELKELKSYKLFFERGEDMYDPYAGMHIKGMI